MRIISRAAVLTLVLSLGPAAGTALAVTTAQIVDLMKAGVGDDVLIALIETDGSSFQLGAADILALHRQGVSDKVILAMQATARKAPVKTGGRSAVAQAAADPQLSEPRAADEPAVAGTTPQVINNIYQTVSQRVEPAHTASTQVVPIPFAVPVYVRAVPVKQTAPPVYWGWNGQRRPDTWQETPSPGRSPAQADAPAKKGGS